MKKKIIYGLLSVLVLVFAVGMTQWMVNAKVQPKKSNKKLDVTYVKVEKINYKETESEMKYRGRVTAFDVVSLSAEVSGKILQGDVRFKAGERYNKGQVLLRVYSEDVEASLMSAKSSYLQILARVLPDIKVDFSDEYDKWLDFFNAIDVSKSLPKLPQINTQKEKVFLASNNVLTNYYNIQKQEIDLARHTIYAPFDGSFKSVKKEIGAVASPGAELATLIRSDKLEVTVPVFPRDLSFINKNDKVEIVSTAGYNQQTTVSRVSNFVDAATQSVNVYLTFSAADVAGFLEGEYVDVAFSSKSIYGFEIPREAIANGGKVYVLENGKLSLVNAKIIRELEDSCIITLSDSTAVVVTESLASVNTATEYKARK